MGFVVAAVLTRRVTHSLVGLSEAATAVASGHLDKRVVASENDEIGRLGMAFNSMTESLQRTLAALSERQAIAAVGEFASALAHEIRNPLSAIRLNLQYVEERVADARLLEAIRNALRDIVRLDTTVAGALRLARTGRMPMTSVALGPIVASAARAALPDPARRGVTLELAGNGSSDGTYVTGNAAALEQLLLNLLLNAADATPSGGRIGVDIGTDREHVTIDVWDTGSGLAPDAAARAFEPFFTTKAEGTGLGLSIAKRIVDAHHGHIALHSRQSIGRRVRPRVAVPGLLVVVQVRVEERPRVVGRLGDRRERHREGSPCGAHGTRHARHWLRRCAWRRTPACALSPAWPIRRCTNRAGRS